MSTAPATASARRVTAFRVLRWTIALAGCALLAWGGLWAVNASQADGTRRWMNGESVPSYLAMVAVYAAVSWAARGLRRPARTWSQRLQGAGVETLVVGFLAAPALALVVFTVAFFANGGPQ